MPEVLVFATMRRDAHRAFLAFAEELRAAGHTGHAPDLNDGRTFASLEDGVGHARELTGRRFRGGPGAGTSTA